MKVLIKKLLRSPLFKELLISVLIVACEALAPGEKPKSTRSRSGA
jgi:hypothetical protein